ncbi:MAG TPA: DUF2478 domain-containing protein [Lacunisphaera sp.]|nr:DUF2478 domain-containing protein [Lacunisphaera sp.]
MPADSSTSPATAPGLLIAVTGAPGSSKTRLLAELAARQLARGHRVEGVLALAGRRGAPGRGADEYWLRLVGSDQEAIWAVRDETLDPPYRFEPEAERKLHVWAGRLRAEPPAPLLVLDEFGRFELSGKGLLPLWPTLAAAAPQVVVIAVRAGLVEGIEGAIGRRFDLVVDAGAPDALERLQRACEDFGEWTRIGLFGGASGSLELTIGSAVHAARLPLAGLAMASLQSAMMVFAGAGLAQPGRVVWVPFVSGGLKALSPAGNRVRPMIAIIVQGLLFGSSVQVLGWNPAALALGGALVGAWAALQGFFLQYLLMGEELVRAYDQAVRWLAQHWQIAAPSLPWLVGAWTLVHAVVAAGITLTAWRLQEPPASLQRVIDREERQAGDRAAPRHRRLREFTQWQFWLPLVVVAAILALRGGSWEEVAWLVLRFIAVGLVLMALVSILRPARWAEQLRQRGWWGPAVAFASAVRRRPGEK